MIYKEDYAYITGAIRTLELKIVDDVDLERMIDAPDVDDAFKILNDTDYANSLLGLNAVDFETALQKESIQTKEFILRNIPNQKLAEILFLHEDWHNIKLLLKYKFFNQEFKNHFSYMGLVSPENLKDFILGNKNNGIQDSVKKSITEIETLLQKEIKESNDNSLKAFMVDILCDQEYFKILKEKSNSFKNSFVTNYVKALIDVSNIRITLRCFPLEEGTNILNKHIIDGGNIPNKIFINSNQDGIESFVKKIKPYITLSFFNNLITSITNSDYSLFEKYSAESIANKIKTAKYSAYGPEVVLSYIYRKNIALNNIRLILLGKLNKLKPEEFKEKIIQI